MHVGLIGIPGSGKTTLFGALARVSSGAGARMAALHVPDPRVDRLAEMSASKKRTAAEIVLHDLPALSIHGSQEGESVAAARGVDLLMHVVGAFMDPGNETGLAAREIRAMEEEMILLDQALIESRLEKVRHMVRVGRKELEQDLHLLERLRSALEEGRAARRLSLDPADEKRLRGFQLLTMKPRLVVLNIAEADVANGLPGVKELDDLEAESGARVVEVCALLEREVSELPSEDVSTYLSELGIRESAREKLIRAAYSQLGFITFFTSGKTETRAWTVRVGTRAVEAAGEIHSDMERGFIRAEVVPCEDLVSSGSYAAARSKGLLRVEGRDYTVKDGDVIVVRFSA
jgi:GTP-binding protein YchF